uniref:Fucosyltransferase n=1 Tax=Timema bartmani TaxID=61472 RepID=A0A7R9ERT0_9NEOP|nr:unnamed protein product [Timema bartmani]
MMRTLSANDRSTKKILFWNEFFDVPNFGLGLGQSPFLEAGCPVTNCFLSNREYVTTNVEDFDAILFHLWLYPSKGDEIMDGLIVNTERYSIVYPRKPHQRYVLFLLEPPGTYLSDLKDLPNFFNWTMTYRYDSDIYRPYGYFRPLNGSSKMVDPRETSVQWKQPTMSSDALEEYLNLSKKKTKLVAWFVSKCRTQGKREEFVEDLKKYVQVDVYGSCGSMSCSRSRGGDCFQMLDQDYKFYLSFENSLCQDYVTEKLFRYSLRHHIRSVILIKLVVDLCVCGYMCLGFGIMRHNVVPVVYGGADYGRLAPPGSYIDARSFPDARSLGEFLRHLDRTPEEYARYFWWKAHYGVANKTAPFILCQLCQKLNDPGLQPKTYSDIHQWYSGPDVCREPHQ